MRRTGESGMLNIEEKLALLPDSPGVYIMKNAQGTP